MDYEQMIDAAAAYAIEAHTGQRDKLGVPYILHVARVATAVADDPAACVVGWLHDAVEDVSDVSLVREQALADLGNEYAPEIVEAVRLLTKPRGGDHADYVRGLVAVEGRAGELARKVKHADVIDNAGRLPMDKLDEQPWGRMMRKYVAALNILEGRE
jgi:(p)ppGpp synthase/HD superfamily hydrolase